MLRAIMGRHGPKDVLANAELAVAQERPESPWRTNALWLLGAAHLLGGDLAAADARFEEAIAAGPTPGGTAMVAMASRASVAMARGDWTAAEDFTRQSHRVLVSAHFEELVASLIVVRGPRRASPSTAATSPAVARSSSGPRSSVRWPRYGVPWFSVHALLELARAYLAASDPAGAQVALRQAEQIVRHRPALGVLTDQLLDLRARLAEATSTLAGSSTLTNAELRLLPLLPTYLSFQEIADRLADLAQHGQDPRDVDLRQAPGVVTRRGRGAGRRARPAGAVSRPRDASAPSRPTDRPGACGTRAGATARTGPTRRGSRRVATTPGSA